MTLADKLIYYQFRFEYGISKVGIYVAIINLGLLIVANLTLKGIFFPIWGIIPIAIILVIVFTIAGDFLIKYNVAGRLTSHFNKTTNPEFVVMMEQVNRIENALGIGEEQLTWEIP
jgi:hypothetical protein